MPTYPEYVKSIIKLAHTDHDFTNLESKVFDLATECSKDLADKPMTEAIGIATNKFENVIDDAWKALYLIPTVDLIDAPEKWEIVESSSMIGKDIKISPTESIHVEMLERHVDTILGSPACVYRINANSRFAMMMMGTTVIEYETENGEDMQITNSYSCLSFIQKFPFTVPYPTVTTVIHVKDKETGEVEDYGYISDIRNLSREEVSAEDLHHHFFSPAGTSLFPVAETTQDSTSEESSDEEQKDCAN